MTARFRDISSKSNNERQVIVMENNSQGTLPPGTRSSAENLESTLNKLATHLMFPADCLKVDSMSPLQTPPESSDVSPYSKENCSSTTAEKLQASADKQPPNPPGCDSEDTTRQQEKIKAESKQWYEHLLRATKNEAHFQQRVGGLDFVPAFKSQGWPKVAQEWVKRKRKWPSPDMVDKVIQEGFHLVVNAPENDGNPDCDFRISFSHAEYLLSQEMNDVQRECYRCLKKCHRAYLSTEPKSLVSFHLKNILLRTIEETGAEMWTESNRANCMMESSGSCW